MVRQRDKELKETELALERILERLYSIPPETKDPKQIRTKNKLRKEAEALHNRWRDLEAVGAQTQRRKKP
jgi:hypothetical protein